MKEIKGVIPAHLCPFHEDFSIDEKSQQAHVAYLAEIKGLGGIVSNGHASEVLSLTPSERQRNLALAIEAAAGKVPIYCGIFLDNTADAVREAKMALREGADGLLLHPAIYFKSGGGTVHPELAFQYFQDVAAATDLPMILFSLPKSTGLNISLDKMLRICEEIPNVAAIKEYSSDIDFYEMLCRELRTFTKKVSLLTAWSKTLVATLAVGGEGIVSGAGSVISEGQLAIFNAIQSNDLEGARKAADGIWPLVELFYRDPWTDSHNRMKYVAKKLGRISCEAVRRPLLPLSQKERGALDAAIQVSSIVRQ